MEVTLKVGKLEVPYSLTCVSILVLMEVTLKEGFGKPPRGYWSGFNPCFNGSDSKSKCGNFGKIFRVVSILVLMEVTLKAARSSEGARISLVSILVLMEVTLKGLAAFFSSSVKSVVSILVLMEVTLKVCSGRTRAGNRQFQSLF